MSEPVHTTETPAPTPAEQAAPPAETDWEAEAKKWEKRSKDNFAKLKDAEPKLAEYEQYKAANQTETERQAQELTRLQGQAETWRNQAVGSRIQAFAADSFADPSDALAALSIENYLDNDGQIDDAAIQKDLTEVLERKPHWRKAAESGGSRLPWPNLAQGTGTSPPASADPNRAFLRDLMSGQT